MWKTAGVKQALDKHGFDAALGVNQRYPRNALGRRIK